MTSHLTTTDEDLDRMVRRTIPGMAHWAGSGPRGKSCGQCQHFVEMSIGVGRSTRCHRYETMTGQQGTKKIPVKTPACKYFEAKR
jgi:hypothetical protein